MITSENYIDLLKDYTLLLVNGDSCGTCYSVYQTLYQLCLEKNINLYQLEIANVGKEFIDKYEIYSYPTVLLFHEQTLKGKMLGYQPLEIIELWLEEKMKEKR